MPELAEVEFNRRQWDAGLKARVQTVEIHDRSRVCRFLAPSQVKQHVEGARLLSSEAFGKRMLFRFSGGGWLGVHLGMTGSAPSALLSMVGERLLGARGVKQSAARSDEVFVLVLVTSKYHTAGPLQPLDESVK